MRSINMSCSIRFLRCNRLLPAVSILLLSACSLVPHGAEVKALAGTGIETAEADRKSFNDKKAEVLLTLPCDISIGAYYRLASSVKQEALAMLCSGRHLGEAPPRLN